MDRIYEYDLPPRSASMPSPGTMFPPGYFQPLNAAAATTASSRKLSSRRDSEMVLSEGPITPPESPGLEEFSLGQEQQPTLEIVMEQTQTPFSQVDYPATPVSQTPDEMDEDTIPEDHTLAISRQPVRSLSQEHIEMPRSNSLRLTDFEVRGTLGKFYHVLNYTMAS